MLGLSLAIAKDEKRRLFIVYSSLTWKPNSTLSWTEKELTLSPHCPGNLCTLPRQPLHKFPGNPCTLPWQPKPSPKLFPLTFDPLIGIELYKMLHRLEVNFLVPYICDVTVEPGQILILSNSTPTCKPNSTSVCWSMSWLCFPTEGRKEEQPSPSF